MERSSYESAEERVINQLRELNKPFVVLLNSVKPSSDSVKELADRMSEKYENRLC